MDNAPLGWMPKQEFLKVLYLELYFLFVLMICRFKPNRKLFPNDISLLSMVTNQINNDLHNVNTLGYQWKMNFNPDTNKHKHRRSYLTVK